MNNRLAVKTQRGDFYGYIEGDTFVKHVYGSKHKLLKPEAWSIDANSFDKLIRPSCRVMVIIDRETNIRYQINVEDLIKYKGEINRGYGKQYFCILEHWGK